MAFEYKTIEGLRTSSDDYEFMLKELGSEGWELIIGNVSSNYSHSYNYIFVFKREIKESTQPNKSV